ncbi:MAG: biopolymer transporter ExbD [Halobacteriovoraceae bacterium]|nr:biopolymer transporter ExbD [Halobacteriovoraceae bacterium]
MSIFRPKKDLNHEINLTPFIDLLSTIVCFLLISAVWVQIGSMEVKQSKGTQAQASKKLQYEMDLKFKNSNALSFVIKRNGRRVRTFKVEGKNNKSMVGNLDRILKKWLESKQGKLAKIESALVTPKRGVNYGELVAALDILRRNKIINIGVIPGDI